MIRDHAILVRPDGSVMFDVPAYGSKGAAASRDGWHDLTARKAVANQAAWGVALTEAGRIAPEERPNPKVRNAVRMDALTGRLSVDFQAAKLALRDRWKAQSDFLRRKLEKQAESAEWFDLGEGIESAAVMPWEQRLAAVVSESKRLGEELRLAKSVEDLIAIEPHWPQLKEAGE